jgi:hypothetical protein
MLVQTRRIPVPNISLETFKAAAPTKPRMPAPNSKTNGTRAAYFADMPTIAPKCRRPSDDPRIHRTFE